MRQVRARAARGKKETRATRRGRATKRETDFRPEKRARRQKSSFFAAKLQSLSRFGDALPFRKPMLVLTAGLLGFAALGGLIAGGHASAALGSTQTAFQAGLVNAGFALKEIVLFGNERTTEAEVREALGVAEGGSIFALDPVQARARLMEIPWIAEADVRRRLPDAVSVRLVEKLPFALWQDGREFVLVERSGNVIVAAERAPDVGRLPVLLGHGAASVGAPLIDSLLQYKAVGARLIAMERVAQRRWDLHLTAGVTVRLPEEGWERELSELERLIVERGVLERNIEMIDLRYPDNYIFRLHNGDSQPIPREHRA